MRFLQRFKRHLGTVEKVMGGLLVLTGILFLTGGMASIAYWLLEAFPALSRIG
jgi:cytochrome c-type biogenesis protein